jgi:hypothetical protein
VGWDAKSSRSDLGGVKTKIFLQKGLDTPFNKPPDGQITTRQRDQIPSCSGRGAAFFTLLRRAGTHSSGTMEPASAAHHAAIAR